MKKYISYLLLTMLLASACVSTGKMKSSQKYFPRLFRDLSFGMPLEEAQKQRPAMEETKSLGDFRVIMTEKEPAPGIQQVTYYFNNKEEKPLYELIIEYDTEAMRDEVADDLLGAPNVEDEWRIPLRESYGERLLTLMAWKYKKKLILACNMKGSEWEDEE